MTASKSALNQPAISRTFPAKSAVNNPGALKGKDFTQMCAKSRTHLPQNLRIPFLGAPGKLRAALPSDPRP